MLKALKPIDVFDSPKFGNFSNESYTTAALRACQIEVKALPKIGGQLGFKNGIPQRRTLVWVGQAAGERTSKRQADFSAALKF